MITKIYIPKKLYLDKILTPKELFYYAAIKPIQTLSYGDTFILNTHQLSHIVYGKLIKGRHMEIMINSIESLLNKGVLKGFKLLKNVYEIECEKYEKQYYSVITYQELLQLSTFGSKRFDIFQYFCALIGSFNGSIDVDGNNYIIGTQHMTYFSELLNISPSTLSSYNKILEDSKMIYFVRKYGENSINIGYCRYSDKDLLDKYTHNIKDICNNQYNRGNLRRSIVQRYNRFVKNPEVFSPEKILELKELCVSYNEEMDKLGGDYLKRKKDLTVFNS
jgi:hypothetical protein